MTSPPTPGERDYSHRRYEIDTNRLLSYSNVLAELYAKRDEIDRAIALVEAVRPPRPKEAHDGDERPAS